MKLTLIAEGSTMRERKALRWGVSFLAGNVLFDAFGREDVFWENVHRFRIDLSRVRHVVVSHGDWDHIAAIGGLLRTHPGLKVHLCGKAGKTLKELVRANGGKIVPVSGPVRISGNIFSLGQMRADTSHGVLYEQALAVKTRNGVSVVTGCAHPGIVRTVRRAAEVFGMKVHTVCGGFHMKDNTLEKDLKIVAELQALGVKKVAPLHCTGASAVRLFRQVYGKRCLDMKEGTVLNL